MQDKTTMTKYRLTARQDMMSFAPYNSVLNVSVHPKSWLFEQL